MTHWHPIDKRLLFMFRPSLPFSSLCLLFFGSTIHPVSVFIARDHLSLGLGVRCWVCAQGEGEEGWADATGCVKPDQISQGLAAAWGPLILTACLQNVFLRPGLAFQQLLQFQGTKPVAYSLSNWCRFLKRKWSILLTGLQVTLQTPRWPRRNPVFKLDTVHLNYYLFRGDHCVSPGRLGQL